MAFVQLCDQIAQHPKILRAGAEAAWLWACAIAYCNRQLTDGQLPTEALATLGTFRTPVQELAATLVAVGLLERTEQGYAVHDYLQHNPDRETVRQRIKVATERKAAYRAAKEGRPSAVPPVSRACPADVPLGQTQDKAGTDTASRAHVPTPTPTPTPTPVSSLRSDTHTRASGTAEVVTPNWGEMPTRRRKAHCAYESGIGLDVPQALHDEFAAKLRNAGDATADQTLQHWYLATEQAFVGREVGDDAFDFWRARFKEWRGTTTRAVTAPVSSRYDIDLDAAVQAQLALRRPS